MAEIDFSQFNSAAKALMEALNKNTEALIGGADADTKAKDQSDKEFKKVTESLKKFGSELIKIGDAGIKLGNALGTSAVSGVQLELKNRTEAIKQLISLDLNRAATISQIRSAEQALADTFIGVREGFQISSAGAAAFANNLKGGFRSEFQLTGESLRALTIIGATTTQQFDAFRQATGRASLSSGQLSNIVNKNSLSFLLFGNKFAKAAADAEKIGVSLASIQSAQAGLVTNLDSTIDTVAQLNQLGADIEFGTFMQKLEQEGPDAVLSYLRASVPAELFKSTSFRALFEQLGVSSEQLLRAGAVRSTADELEVKMTEAATSTGIFSNSLTLISRGADVFNGSLIALTISAGAAALALRGVGIAGLMTRLGAGAAAAGLAAGAAPIAAGIAITGAAALAGAAMMQTLAKPEPTVRTAPNLSGINIRPPAPEGAGQYVLGQKVDRLVDAIERANTTVTIDGTTKTVNRLGLVGVYSRNERGER